MFNAKVKTFLSARHGVAALEFALVAPLYFALIMSGIELGWIMTKSTMLDYAVINASKFVYTGAAQQNSLSNTDIEDFICSRALILTNCNQNITVELTPITAITSPPTTDIQCRDAADTSINPVVTYDPGAGSTIVFMRVCVSTEIFTPFLGVGLALPKNDQGRYEMITSTAFVNEPF